MTLVKPGFEVSFTSIGTAKEERKETLVRSLTDESLSSPIAALDVSTKSFYIWSFRLLSGIQVQWMHWRLFRSVGENSSPYWRLGFSPTWTRDEFENSGNEAELKLRVEVKELKGAHLVRMRTLILLFLPFELPPPPPQAKKTRLSNISLHGFTWNRPKNIPGRCS